MKIQNKSIYLHLLLGMLTSHFSLNYEIIQHNSSPNALIISLSAHPISWWHGQVMRWISLIRESFVFGFQSVIFYSDVNIFRVSHHCTRQLFQKNKNMGLNKLMMFNYIDIVNRNSRAGLWRDNLWSKSRPFFKIRS